MTFLLEHITLLQFACLLAFLSFLISYTVIPKLIGIASYKKLMDKPNSRSSHQNKTPTLGGIAFFVSLVLCIFFLKFYDTSDISINIIVALTILFITGVKDDLMVLGPRSKILAQLLAFTFLLVNTDLHIINWHGFLGFTNVPLGINIILSYIAMLAIINAYNLIDGIDGLASLMGMAIFAVFGMVFYSLNLHFYFLLSVIAISFLVAFFRYNVSKKQKIFMGDTGSMIVGFLIGLFTLRFLALTPESLVEIGIAPANLLLLILAILFIPMLDVFRVIMIRLLRKQSPFAPDRNHVHHIFVDLGWSHLKTSIFLGVYSLFIAVLFFVFNTFLSTNSVLFLLVVTSLLNLVLVFHINPHYNALRQKLKIKAALLQLVKNNLIPVRSLRMLFRIFF